MFLDLPPEVAYSDLWEGAFEERLAALKRGRVRVAYYYDYPDASTFRYRVHNMIEVLRAGHPEGGLDVSASWFCYADAERIERAVEAADILVVCRARYTDRINGMITRAKNLGREVIFDVDDLVVDPDYVHLLAHSLDQDLTQERVWDFWFGYVGRVAATMRLCDRVIVTNEYLADRVAACSGKQVSIIPNFINRDQFEVSDRIFEAKLAGGFKRDEWIHLGYFSGSPSHNRDFAIISGPLARLLDDDPRLRLRVVGYLDVKGPVARHADRIDRFPMQDYLNLQRLIGSTEINLAPLQDNQFTNCKSELKYFEAAIVGTATIASPTFVFARAIRDGDNGWLAGSHEWTEAIGKAIDALAGPDRLYEQVAERAREHATRHFSWEHQGAAIRAALFGESRPVLDPPPASPARSSSEPVPA